MIGAISATLFGFLLLAVLHGGDNDPDWYDNV